MSIKQYCPACEQPLTKREHFPYCEECSTTLTYTLAQINRIGGDEVHQPRCTDTGNGLRFARLHYYDVLYVPEARSWFVWNGQVWEQDKQDILMMQKAKLVTQWMFRAAARIKDDADLRDAQLAWAKSSESVNRLKAMIESARTTCRKVSYEQLDAAPLLLNVANVTIDLRTGETRPFSRRDLMTKASTVEYDPTATAPRWEQFLVEILPQHVDCCLPFLQRAMGYTTTGCINEECFFVLWGHGRNGKTKFIETIRHILGPHAKGASFDSFVARRGDEKLNDIAGFRGSRMILASESEHSKRLAEAKIRKMTGREKVTGEFKYEEQFDYLPTYKIWLVTNYKPKVVGTDDAIWDRTHLVPFTEYFDDSRRDTHLGEKLLAETPGILNWLIRGAVMWNQNGLGTPKCVKETTEEYRRDQNVLGHFFEDKCLKGEELWVSQPTLYKSYKAWADESGEYVMTKTEFNDRMRMDYLEHKTSTRGRHWVGLALKHEEEFLNDPAKVEAVVKSTIN